jgi:hypothetical protein
MTLLSAQIRELRHALVKARKNGQYHRLTGIDTRIRSCAEKAFANSQWCQQNDRDVFSELQAVLAEYRQVIDDCDEKGQRLRQELGMLNAKKGKALQYLNVAKG